MKFTIHRYQIISLVAVFWPFSTATAFDLPPLNLGFTSFLDGGPPAGEGLYYSPIIQWYTSDSFQDVNSNDIILPTEKGPRRHKVEVLAILNKFVYQSDINGPLGSKWGLDVVIPAVNTDLEPGNSLAVRDNSFGIGDITIGPFLQWGPVMSMMRPIFSHRLELAFVFPTGRYDDDFEINPGSNHFSFNPYWAGTLFLTPRWTTSWRFHYLWNAENSEPSKRTRAALRSVNPGLEVDNIRPGQAIHLNFTSAFAVIPDHFRLGLNGYYLKQITDTEIDGVEFSGRREEVLAIGPGAVLHLSRDTHLFFNAYFEIHTENRTEGERFNFRLVHHF